MSITGSIHNDSHAAAPVYISDSRAIQITLEAHERLLSDMDSFTDWLGAQCMGSDPKLNRIGYVPRDSVHLLSFIESLDAPQLLALSLYPRADVQGKAMSLIRERYIEASADYINRLADQIAREET